ncbi:hypothetical protein BUALT_Bualt12G0124000 [Buddleja alternifolia]|uniref:Uncharacterized protein n=1 Tax=Buddleja alternifolia TaxID=168488 RepID=A0AAV6WPM8_9LAMI|nr:hypothetical protein BUALT_Bualt12G0124000 [Buddleja alternifolia]
MSLHDPKFNDYELPNYHDLEPAVTLVIHHGGQFHFNARTPREVHVYLEATMDLLSQVGSSNVNEVHEPNDLGDFGEGQDDDSDNFEDIDFNDSDYEIGSDDGIDENEDNDMFNAHIVIMKMDLRPLFSVLQTVRNLNLNLVCALIQKTSSQVMTEKSSAQVWMSLDETRNKTKGKGIAIQDTEKIKFSSKRCCSNSTRKCPVFKAPRTVSSEALTAPSRQSSASLEQTRKSATRAHAGAPKPSPRPPRPQSQPSALRAATTFAKSTSAPITPRGATRGATRPATPRPDSPESVTTSTGLKIKHVPLSPDHPRTFIPMITRKRKPLRDCAKFIVKEGKKYVTMKNLNDALNVKKAEFEVGQRKNDLFFVELLLIFEVLSNNPKLLCDAFVEG